MTDNRATMRLQVFMPEHIVLDCAARKVVAEGASGSFGILPRHIDFVEPLVPGILAVVSGASPGPESDADERFVAVDEGVLVKCGRSVFVSVRNAVVGAELGALEQTVRDQFRRIDTREQAMRSALAKLEADVVRRFIEME